MSSDVTLAAMAGAIIASSRPLADMRGIIMDLSLAGFLARDIHRHLDNAIARARDVRTQMRRRVA